MFFGVCKVPRCVVLTAEYTYDDVGLYDGLQERVPDDEYDEDRDSWQYDDYYEDGENRPKRDEEDLYQNGMDREAIREMLAERAAEEARLALIAYLTSGEPRPEEPKYLVDPLTEDLALDDDDYNALMNEDEEQPEVYDDEPEMTEKRFYPYSYEPYGGRWGALVPGTKRADRDPYDRLYRLAEVLSRPAQLGDDYEKK